MTAPTIEGLLVRIDQEFPESLSHAMLDRLPVGSVVNNTHGDDNATWVKRDDGGWHLRMPSGNEFGPSRTPGLRRDGWTLRSLPEASREDPEQDAAPVGSILQLTNRPRRFEFTRWIKRGHRQWEVITGRSPGFISHRNVDMEPESLLLWEHNPALSQPVTDTPAELFPDGPLPIDPDGAPISEETVRAALPGSQFHHMSTGSVTYRMVAEDSWIRCSGRLADDAPRTTEQAVGRASSGSNYFWDRLITAPSTERSDTMTDIITEVPVLTADDLDAEITHPSQLNALPVGAKVRTVRNRTHHGWLFVKLPTGKWQSPQDTNNYDQFDADTFDYSGGMLFLHEWPADEQADTQLIDNLDGWEAPSPVHYENNLALERAVREAEERVRSEYQAKIAALNEKALEYARRFGMCSEFEALMDEDEAKALKLRGRDREYEVTVRVLVEHVRRVRATDEDAAYEQVISDTGFRMGGQHTLYGEDVTIVDVENDHVEEVD